MALSQRKKKEMIATANLKVITLMMTISAAVTKINNLNDVDLEQIVVIVINEILYTITICFNLITANN